MIRTNNAQASNGATRVHVCLWHIASFRCAAEFGRYRGITDIEQTTAIKLLYEYAP